MGKDPAFLFYINDWRSGTTFRGQNNAYKMMLRGCYLELLLEQADIGYLTEDDIKDILGSLYNEVWPFLKNKFIEKYGKLYNEKMSKVLKQRMKFCESRRVNRMGKTKIDKKHVLNKSLSSDKHMENRNRNKDLNKNINEIYNNYPTKCPVNGRSTGKGNKCKDKIKKLLKEHSLEYLIDLQNKYINDCVDTQCYIKNYLTFLNNLPDPEQFKNKVYSDGPNPLSI
jgi:hypothetical protein